MSETTNLAGGADELTVENPRMNTRSIWGKNAPEHYLPRVKNINEVKIIFFSYLSAFFQNLKILCLFSPLYLEMYAPDSVFCRFNLVLISNIQDRQRFFKNGSLSVFPKNGRTSSRKLATLPLLPHHTCCFTASYLLAPISVPWEKFVLKNKNKKKP